MSVEPGIAFSILLAHLFKFAIFHSVIYKYLFNLSRTLILVLLEFFFKEQKNNALKKYENHIIDYRPNIV